MTNNREGMADKVTRLENAVSVIDKSLMGPLHWNGEKRQFRPKVRVGHTLLRFFQNSRDEKWYLLGSGHIQTAVNSALPTSLLSTVIPKRVYVASGYKNIERQELDRIVATLGTFTRANPLSMAIHTGETYGGDVIDVATDFTRLVPDGTVMNIVVRPKSSTSTISRMLTGWNVVNAFYSELPYIYQMTDREFREDYSSNSVDTTLKKFAVYAIIVEDMVNRWIMGWELDSRLRVKEVRKHDRLYNNYFSDTIKISVKEIGEAIEILDTTEEQSWRASIDPNVTVIQNRYGALRVSGNGMMWDDGTQWREFAKSGLVIEKGVTRVGAWTFWDCGGLTSVTFLNRNSTITIGRGAFCGCTGLTTITIPREVTAIEDMAFKGCTRLTTVISLNTIPPQIEHDTFDGLPLNACLYVPESSVNAYRQALGWVKFKNIRPKGN